MKFRERYPADDFFILHTQQYRQFCTDIWGNDRA